MQTYDFSSSRLTVCCDTAGQTGCKDQSRVGVCVGGLVDSRQVTTSRWNLIASGSWQQHRLRGGERMGDGRGAVV